MSVLQVLYREDFEKNKGKGFSVVADTPELQRIKKTQDQISNVSVSDAVTKILLHLSVVIAVNVFILCYMCFNVLCCICFNIFIGSNPPLPILNWEFVLMIIIALYEVHCKGSFSSFFFSFFRFVLFFSTFPLFYFLRLAPPPPFQASGFYQISIDIFIVT